ncbi:hypothetical protein GCM10009760_19860 [Kitasatospora kazusensis]|uniref:TniQ domain-containing protein n=1 Tax=Kitasatospora kazusensis TaxID=407974 RepID=A0ABN2Z8P5_9ACTN
MLSAVPRARRLPTVVSPGAGESFSAWVDRAAFDLGIGPGQLVRALGLECRASSPSARPMFFGVVLSGESARGLREATGLPASMWRRMHLERYAATALDFAGLDTGRETTLRTWSRQGWAQVYGSRACPLCLADGPVWWLWWRLETAAACPVHGVLLVDVCPGCGIRLRRGSAGSPRGLLERGGEFDPARCGNRVGGRSGALAVRCGQVLAEIPTVAVPGVLVDAQRLVLSVANGGRAPLVGEPVTPAVWFEGLRWLVALVRAAGDQVGPLPVGMPPVAAAALMDGARERAQTPVGVGARVRHGPVSAAEAAGLLAVVAPVLTAPDSDAAGPLLAGWLEGAAGVRRARTGSNPLRGLACPPVLDAVARRVGPRASRVAGALPAVVPGPGGGPVVPGWAVPQLIDPVDYRELIAAHLPGTAELSGRRLAGLALARLAGAGSWRGAAVLLGMDAAWAARVSNTLVQRIGDVPGFWSAVDAVAVRMAGRGLVDFARRREVLADLREVPHDVLYEVCHPAGRPVTWQRCRHAAAWVWQHFTGGDPREAPAYGVPWPGVTAESQREGWRKFRASLLPLIEPELSAWGVGLLGSGGGR